MTNERAMDEQRQEQAAGYVLGVLPAEERAAFERILADDTDLRRLVRDFRDSLGEVALSLPAETPSPELQARILDRVKGTPQARIEKAPTRAQPRDASRSTISSPFLTWIPWAAAAGFALALAWSSLNTRNRIATLVQELDQEREIHASEVERLARDLAEARNATDLARLQVARLASQLADQPRAQAVSLWNNTTKQGVLVVENLALPPAGKTYQLWVIDPAKPGTPVDAGIFALDEQGRGRIVFSPKSPVQAAAAIAISLENAGGVQVPTQVVMAGETTRL